MPRPGSQGIDMLLRPGHPLVKRLIAWAIPTITVSNRGNGQVESPLVSSS